jgi:fructuronate reductase
MPVVNRVPCTGSATQIGIVHLGLGAFHRAHQAVYLQRHLNRHGASDWGLCSANLRSNRTLVEQLREQDVRYHVAEYRDREQVTLREIGVLREALYAGEGGHELEQLLERMAAPQTRIVTLTVTEKGYCLSPSSGQLRRDDPTPMTSLIHTRHARRRESSWKPCADVAPQASRRSRCCAVTTCPTTASAPARP